MKKEIIFNITRIVLLILIILAALKYQDNKKYNDSLSDAIIKNTWSRAGEGDTEFIYFGENGEFSYYCACGNPVDNYDLCDSYKYDKESDTIKLNCSLSTIKDKIKIIENDEYHLVLEIAGEKRTFESEKSYLLENPLEFAGLKFESENITLEFKEDGIFEAFDTKNGGYTLSSDTCFYWTYEKDSNEIKLNCNGEGNKTIKINNYNKETKELELNFTYENKTINFIFTK